jgi:hypothetical protein
LIEESGQLHDPEVGGGGDGVLPLKHVIGYQYANLKLK